MANNAFHLTYETVNSTCLHRAYSVAADNGFRLNEFDTRQLCCALEKRFCRNADTGRNSTTQIFTCRQQSTEGVGSTEIDNNHRSAQMTEFMEGCHSVDNTVCTNLLRIIIFNENAVFNARSYNHRFNAEIALTHVAQGNQHRRHNTGNNDGRNLIHFHITISKHAAQHNTKFICSFRTVCRKAPVYL